MRWVWLYVRGEIKLCRLPNSFSSSHGTLPTPPRGLRKFQHCNCSQHGFPPALQAIAASMASPRPHSSSSLGPVALYNVVDDEPASRAEVGSTQASTHASESIEMLCNLAPRSLIPLLPGRLEHGGKTLNPLPTAGCTVHTAVARAAS